MSLAVEPLPADEFGTSAPRDVILVLGYTSWSGAIRRGLVMPEDRLAVWLTSSPRVGRVLICNPYRSRAAKLVRAVTGPRDEPFPTTETCRLHEPLRLRRQDPAGVGAMERACAAYERGIRRAAEQFGMERPAIISAHPPIAGFGRFDWAGPVTYYTSDDQTACPPMRRWWPVYEVAHARMRELGRGAVGLTPKALASVDPSGPSAVIPCGLDPDEWFTPGEAPSWFTELPGPRLLYVGSLDPRVEVEMVRATAEAYPHGSVVLMGRCPNPEHYDPIRELPNVTIAPPVDREQLTAIVAAADVGLIPHVRTEQTEAMSPLKLFEYLAAGLPVATIDLPGTASVSPSRTALAQGTHDFVDAVRRAVAIGRCTEAERLDFIHANAWERRFERLLDVALEPN
jgi:teichuronic acid biosynthesis glycosyltransferase TuaH